MAELEAGQEFTSKDVAAEFPIDGQSAEPSELDARNQQLDRCVQNNEAVLKELKETLFDTGAMIVALKSLPSRVSAAQEYLREGDELYEAANAGIDEYRDLLKNDDATVGEIRTFVINLLERVGKALSDARTETKQD